MADQYIVTEHSIPEVQAYLAELPEDQRDAAASALVADEKARTDGTEPRSGILALEPTPADDQDVPEEAQEAGQAPSSLEQAQEVGVVGDAQEKPADSEPFGSLKGANPDVPEPGTVPGSGEQGETPSDLDAAFQDAQERGYIGESQSTAGDLSQANPAVMNRKE